MTTPLHATVNSAPQALAAAEAASISDAALFLWTPADSGTALGANWVGAIAKIVRGRYPNLALTVIFDCADWAGAALGALRVGIADLRFTGAPEVAAKLEAMSARLRQRPAAEAMLDLTHAKDPAAACRNWLASRHGAG